jgi:hypothetical protein
MVVSSIGQSCPGVLRSGLGLSPLSSSLKLVPEDHGHKLQTGGLEAISGLV